MDEIYELQKQLKAVQQSESVQRLSERNVVDLVLKLKALDKVKIIYTLSGKEFLTPKQLKDEVNDEITANGGRVRLDEISSVLNVDLSHIESKTQEIIEQDPQVRLLSGIEVITEWYLDNISEEANENLQEVGQTTMGDLATRYALPVDVVQDMVKARLGAQFSGNLNHGTLYTQSYIDRERKRVQGMFSALTRPTTIPSLSAAFGMDSVAVEKHVKSLIADGVLAGRLSGGEYVPHIFAKMQRSGVEQFMLANGYVEKTMTQKLKIKGPLKFIKQFMPDVIELKSCFVGSSVLQALEADIAECVGNESFVDAKSILLPVFTTDDCFTLCQSVKAISSRRHATARLVKTSDGGGVYIVSNACIAVIEKAVVAAANTKAREWVTKKRSNAPLPTTSATPVKSKKSAEQQQQQQPSRKSKKGKKGKRGTAAEDLDFEDAPAPTAQVDDYLNAGQKEVENTRTVAKSVAAADENLEFVPALVDELVPGMVRLASTTFVDTYQEALHSVFQGSSAARRKITNALDNDFEAKYAEFQLYAKAVDKWCGPLVGAADPEDFARWYPMKFVAVVGKQLVSALLTYEVASSWHDGEFPKEKQTLESMVEAMWTDAEARKQIMENTIQNAKEFAPLVNMIVKVHTLANSNSTLEDFSVLVSNCIGQTSLSGKSVDKKSERSVLHNHRAQLLNDLQANPSSNPTGVMDKGCLIILQQLLGAKVWAPVDECAEDMDCFRTCALDLFKLKLPEDSFQQIHSLAKRLESDNIEIGADEYENTIKAIKSIAAMKDPSAPMVAQQE